MDNVLAFIAVLFATTTVFFAAAFILETSEEPKKVLVVSPSSSSATLKAVMDTRFKMEKASDTTVWTVSGSPVNEDDIFAQFGITKKSQKETFRKEMAKQGYKRHREVCYNMYLNNKQASAGYCYNIEIEASKSEA